MNEQLYRLHTLNKQGTSLILPSRAHSSIKPRGTSLKPPSNMSVTGQQNQKKIEEQVNTIINELIKYKLNDIFTFNMKKKDDHINTIKTLLMKNAIFRTNVHKILLNYKIIINQYNRNVINQKQIANKNITQLYQKQVAQKRATI